MKRLASWRMLRRRILPSPLQKLSKEIGKNTCSNEVFPDDVKKSKSSKSKFSRRQTLLKNWIDRRIKTEDEKKDYPQNFFVRSNRNAKIKTLHKMIPYRRGTLKKSKREKEKTVMNKILGKEEVMAVK